MKDKAGIVYRIGEKYPWVSGCTMSGILAENSTAGVEAFSLAPGTQISPASYRIRRLWFVQKGQMRVEIEEKGEIRTAQAQSGELYIVPKDLPIGVRTGDGCVYLEIMLKEDQTMNVMLKSGEVFRLADLVPYQEGRIVSMDLIDQEKIHFSVMSFSAGTSLKEHAAPADVLVTALDGEGVIGYEGKEYRIHAGENFKFDKNGRHYVKADQNFKMALLIVKE
jgi:quercetin dioxygenase-like cupin family protein